MRCTSRSTRARTSAAFRAATPAFSARTESRAAPAPKVDRSRIRRHQAGFDQRFRHCLGGHRVDGAASGQHDQGSGHADAGGQTSQSGACLHQFQTSNYTCGIGPVCNPGQTLWSVPPGPKRTGGTRSPGTSVFVKERRRNVYGTFRRPRRIRGDSLTRRADRSRCSAC